MKKSSYVRALQGGVLGLVLGGALAGCGGARDTEEARETAQHQIESEASEAKKQLNALQGAVMQDSELSGGDAQGRPLWRISAKEIRVFNQPVPATKKSDATASGEEMDESEQMKKQVAELSAQPRRAILKEARAMLYKEGKLDATFVAPRAVVNYTPDGVRIQMEGGISARSAGGWAGKRGAATITAPRSEVNVKARKLWLTGGVRIVQGVGSQRIHVASNQLQADTSLKVTKLMGAVKATSARGRFTAQEASWNWETERASAQGSVTATNDEMTLTGARLDADTVAQRGLLSGGVQATNEKGKARASSVSYDWKNHTIMASGGVLLDKDDAALQAGQIQADDQWENATASRGVKLKKGDVQVSANNVTVHRMGKKDSTVSANGDVQLLRSDFTITADRAQATGLQDKSTLRVVASGHVYGKSKDGAVRAGRATWGGGQVVASGGVTLYRDGNSLSGTRLVCDDKFTKATLTGDIHGELARGGTLSARQMTYRKDQGVTAAGGVAARRGALRLRADNLTATPDGNHLTLTGRVVVTNEDGATISAPEARYDRVAQKVYASGDVYLHDPQRGLRQRGRKLVADLKLHQVTLTEVSGSGKMDVFKDKKLF